MALGAAAQLLLPLAALAQEAAPRLRAGQAPNKKEIDGLLDEAAYKDFLGTL